MSLSDEDYNSVLNGFQAVRLNKSEIPDTELFQWLHYRADLYMLDYYIRNKSNHINKDSIKQKARYLYDRIKSCYPEFYKENEALELEICFEMPSYFNLKKCISSIIKSGYPHQVLTFCYKTLIDDWDNERIIKELAASNLEAILNNFINEYSTQSDLPTFMTSLYFLDLKEKLNKRFKSLISSNDSITPVKLEKYLNWVTGWTMLNFYFGKNGEHDISDWSNKIKKKAVLNIINSIEDFDK